MINYKGAVSMVSKQLREVNIVGVRSPTQRVRLTVKYSMIGHGLLASSCKKSCRVDILWGLKGELWVHVCNAHLTNVNDSLSWEYPLYLR